MMPENAPARPRTAGDILKAALLIGVTIVCLPVALVIMFAKLNAGGR